MTNLINLSTATIPASRSLLYATNSPNTKKTEYAIKTATVSTTFETINYYHKPQQCDCCKRKGHNVLIGSLTTDGQQWSAICPTCYGDNSKEYGRVELAARLIAGDMHSARSQQLYQNLLNRVDDYLYEDDTKYYDDRGREIDSPIDYTAEDRLMLNICAADANYYNYAVGADNSAVCAIVDNIIKRYIDTLTRVETSNGYKLMLHSDSGASSAPHIEVKTVEAVEAVENIETIAHTIQKENKERNNPYYIKLSAHIVDLSTADNFEDATDEWILDTVEFVERFTCPCGCDSCKEICHIKNKTNGNKTTVGNSCINRFFGLDFKGLFRCLANMIERETANINQHVIDYANERKYIHSAEYFFLNSIDGKRKLSAKQAAWKRKIRYRILNKIGVMTAEETAAAKAVDDNDKLLSQDQLRDQCEQIDAYDDDEAA